MAASIANILDDFDNPQESNFNDISFDAFDMQDLKSASMLKSEAMDVYTRLNVFAGVTEYQGLVLTPPKTIIGNSGLMDRVSQTIGATDTTKAFKIHIPALHRMLGNPCNVQGVTQYGPPTDSQEKLKQKIINDHPWFVVKVWNGIFGVGSTEPEAGDWVTVKFAKGPSGGRMIEGQLVAILGKKIDNASTCVSNASQAFNGNSGQPLRSVAQNAPQQLGTGENIANETTLQFAFPFPQGTAYTVTSGFKPFRKVASLNLVGPHWGTDFAMQEGTTWLASADGKVVVSNVGSGQLTIEHEDPVSGDLFYTTYHHCWQIMVNTGVKVFRGQAVATCGGGENSKRSDENSTGAHLHFEMRRNAAIPSFKANSDNTDATEEFKTAFYSIGFDPVQALTLPGIQYYSSSEAKTGTDTENVVKNVTSSSTGVLAATNSTAALFSATSGVSNETADSSDEEQTSVMTEPTTN